MLSERALVQTFSPPSYADPCEAVEDYRRVMEWASRHPESGSSAAASALDLPQSRIRPWLDRRPDAVRAIETARDFGWFEATPGNDRGRVLAVLSGGNIGAESHVPRFAIDDERALGVLGRGSTRVNETAESRAAELEAARARAATRAGARRARAADGREG